MILLVVLIVSSLGFLPDRVQRVLRLMSAKFQFQSRAIFNGLGISRLASVISVSECFTGTLIFRQGGCGNGELTLVDDSVDSPFPLGVVADRFQHEG